MIVTTTEDMKGALRRLSGHGDWPHFMDWLKESLTESTIAMLNKIDDEPLTRLQGEARSLNLLVEAIEEVTDPRL